MFILINLYYKYFKLLNRLNLRFPWALIIICLIHSLWNLNWVWLAKLFGQIIKISFTAVMQFFEDLYILFNLNLVNLWCTILSSKSFSIKISASFLFSQRERLFFSIIMHFNHQFKHIILLIFSNFLLYSFELHFKSQYLCLKKLMYQLYSHLHLEQFDFHFISEQCQEVIW